MTCPCGRPRRMSLRSLLCIVCARGVKTPRRRYRKVTNYEKAWNLRRAEGKAA